MRITVPIQPLPSDAVHAPRAGAALKEGMRHLVGGVSVVTAGFGEHRTGATVTSAQSLSLEPETMLVSLNLRASTLVAIRRFGHFCVNVLSAHQQAVAERFSGFGGVNGPARYLGSRWAQGLTGAGILEGALVSVDCDLDHVVERHSHALVFGSVRTTLVRSGDALLYAHGRYGRYPAA